MTDAPAANEPFMGAEFSKLGDVKAHELLTRFAFGAAISLGAGIASIVVNPVAGGMFLAFPAILPATLTLIEKREGTSAAVTDVQGAVIGAAALAPFAVVGGSLLRTTGAPVALTLALVTWLTVSVGGYLGVEAVLRRGTARRDGGERPGRDSVAGTARAVSQSPPFGSPVSPRGLAGTSRATEP
jgi:hypothetical protein